MVNKQLGIDTEKAIKRFFVFDRESSQLSHRVDTQAGEPIGDAMPHTPETREWLEVPQFAPIGHLVELGNAHATLIGCNVLCFDIHGHLAQVEVRANARCGGDACVAQHIVNQGLSQLMRRHLVGLQVLRSIDKYLVD